VIPEVAALALRRGQAEARAQLVGVRRQPPVFIGVGRLGILGQPRHDAAVDERLELLRQRVVALPIEIQHPHERAQIGRASKIESMQALLGG
jgi:hypothetical protein